MYKIVKRILDILASLILLSLLFIPMIIISLIILIDSGTPIFFIPKRIGLNGKVIKILKFRSMVKNAPRDVAPKDLDSGKYITNFGKFIRRFSIDELPQLLNVIKGDLSLIGPRPSGLSEKELISLRKKTGVLKLKPGISGLAQVNGRDITALDINRKVEYDKKYLENFGIRQDINIFFKTIGVVLFGSGYKEGKDDK